MHIFDPNLYVNERVEIETLSIVALAYIPMNDPRKVVYQNKNNIK